MDMGKKRKAAEAGCTGLKQEDLLKCSNIYASEFNRKDLHDRVLVLRVMEERQRPNGDDDLDGDFWTKSAYNKGKTATSISKKTSLTNETRINEIKSNFEASGAERPDDIVLPAICSAAAIFRAKAGRKKKQKIRFQSWSMGSIFCGRYMEENGLSCDADSDEYDSGELTAHERSPSSRSGVTERRLYVHSSWLAVQSPYFRALFYSGMTETYSKEVVMHVFEHELEPHIALIEAVYRPDVLDEKQFELVLEVIRLANKYDVRLVLNKCKYILLAASLTIEKCNLVLEVAKDLPDSGDINKMVETFLVKEFRPLDKTWSMDKFLDLSDYSLQVLLSSNDLAVQSENTVFVALMEWIRVNMPSGCAPPSGLSLSLVRFELMSVDFLYDVVRHNTVAKGMLGFNELLQKGLAYHGFSQTRRDQLEDKPVKRVAFLGFGPTFSWIIDSGVRSQLKHFNSAFSSVFWFSGYEMEMELTCTLSTNQYGLYLHVLGLRKESCLQVSWSATSCLFEHPLVVDNETYRYDNDFGGFYDLNIQVNIFEVPEATQHVIDVSVNFPCEQVHVNLF